MARRLCLEFTGTIDRDLDEKKFRWLFNEDAMATERSAERIRVFHADAMRLEKYIAERL